MLSLSSSPSSSSFSGGVVLTTILVVATRLLPLVTLATAQLTYGVDISFPQHHATIQSSSSTSQPSSPLLVLLPGRQDFYDHFLETCRSHNTKPEICDENEVDRIDMNIRQPQSMVNYTALGYTKVKVPPKVFKIIHKFWTDNVGREEVEDWDLGNTYTNHVSRQIMTVILCVNSAQLFRDNSNLLLLIHSSYLPKMHGSTKQTTHQHNL